MPYTPTTWSVNDIITDVKMNKIENGIAAVEQNTNTLIGGVNTSIETINQSIQTINGSIGAINDSIDDINNDITSIQQSIAGIDVSSINNSITQLTSDVSSINTSIETIDTSLETIEGSIEDLEDEVEDLKTVKVFEPETYYERIYCNDGDVRYMGGRTACILTDLTWQQLASYDFVSTTISEAGFDNMYIGFIYVIPSITATKISTADRQDEGYYLEDDTKDGFAIFGLDGLILCLPTDTNIVYYDPNES